MPGGINILSGLRRNDARHKAELGGISCCDLPPSRQIFFELFHLLQAKSATYVSQAIVESQKNHLIVPAACALPLPRINVDPVISKPAKRFGKHGTVSRNHPPLAGRQVLYGMKTEDGHVRNAPHAASAVLRT